MLFLELLVVLFFLVRSSIGCGDCAAKRGSVFTSDS